MYKRVVNRFFTYVLLFYLLKKLYKIKKYLKSNIDITILLETNVLTT